MLASARLSTRLCVCFVRTETTSRWTQAGLALSILGAERWPLLLDDIKSERKERINITNILRIKKNKITK